MRISKKKSLLLNSEIDDVFFCDELNAYTYFNPDIDPKRFDSVYVTFFASTISESHDFKRVNDSLFDCFVCSFHMDLGGPMECDKKIYLFKSWIDWQPFIKR